MMRFLADENFNNKILSGLRKALPDVEIIRLQDTQIYQAPDPKVLEWAAKLGYIILTHDVQSMTKFAYERLKANLPMPGVIEVAEDLPIGRAIDDLAIMIGAGNPSDFENLVKYIPIH